MMLTKKEPETFTYEEAAAYIENSEIYKETYAGAHKNVFKKIG